jgi:hypothetical protein
VANLCQLFQAPLKKALLYLATRTRPDISYAVGVLSRVASSPHEEHRNADKSVLRYLAGTPNMGWLYGDRTNHSLDTLILILLVTQMNVEVLAVLFSCTVEQL